MSLRTDQMDFSKERVNNAMREGQLPAWSTTRGPWGNFSHYNSSNLGRDRQCWVAYRLHSNRRLVRPILF